MEKIKIWIKWLREPWLLRNLKDDQCVPPYLRIVHGFITILRFSERSFPRKASGNIWAASFCSSKGSRDQLDLKWRLATIGKERQWRRWILHSRLTSCRGWWRRWWWILTKATGWGSKPLTLAFQSAFSKGQITARRQR